MKPTIPPTPASKWKAEFVTSERKRRRAQRLLDNKHLVSLQYFLESLERNLGYSIKQSKEQHAAGAFQFIPFHGRAFMEGIMKAKPFVPKTENEYGHTASPKFLDVGCGFGTKVLLASQLGFTGYGLEFDPAYIPFARAIVPHTDDKGSHIIQADARTFNRYAEFDLIYYYCPMSDSKMQKQLTDAVVAGMRPGAVLCICGPTYEHSDDTNRGALQVIEECKSSLRTFFKKAPEPVKKPAKVKKLAA